MSTRDGIQGPVVLVVEDQVLVREDMIDVLEKHGFEALRAADAGGALAVLGDRPDVEAVFTDIQMPGARDGLDLARHVAARHPDIAILVTSGRSYMAPAGLPTGSRFIPKPYMPNAVVRMLREMIGEPPGNRWNPGFGRPHGDRGSSATAA
jgi:CheY-like chemotaxis protein